MALVFLGMFKIRLTSTGWAALDGIHGLPWKHNRNMVENKRIKCIHVCGIQGTLEYVFFFLLLQGVIPFKYIHLNTGSLDHRIGF